MKKNMRVLLVLCLLGLSGSLPGMIPMGWFSRPQSCGRRCLRRVPQKVAQVATKVGIVVAAASAVPGSGVGVLQGTIGVGISAFGTLASFAETADRAIGLGEGYGVNDQGQAVDPHGRVLLDGDSSEGEDD